jgi:single-stranded-DNA-specific exonuclease
LVSELRALGARADFFIPDRERDGYGITPRLVRRAAEVGVRVLISVDCGSSDHAAIGVAQAAGIDVLVVDHHEIPAKPPAHAVLNPKRADCAYPFKGLSAVGVAYKLLQALGARLGLPLPADGCDLVALGALADVQPMRDENRILVWNGLRRLSGRPRPGLTALREIAGIETTVGSREIGFRLVPRLNAVGRIARGQLAVDLLLATDAAAARALARQLEAQNDRRRVLEQAVTRAALEAAAREVEQRDPAALVLASTDWHPGVVGITAARLVDRFARPAAVVGMRDGVGRGSVRSTGNLDVRAALAAAGDLLVRFGGHREAAGFTLQAAHLEAFRDRFTSAIASQARPAAATPGADTWLDADEVTMALVLDLEKLEPFGTGNGEPRFLVRGLQVGAKARLVAEKHLKAPLETPSGRILDGIAFGAASRLRPVDVAGRCVDVIASVRRQDPRFGDDVQLVIADLVDAASPRPMPAGRAP